jgi:uncharacterized phage protein gp47/JayE
MTMFATRSDLFAVGRRSIIDTPGTRINPAVIDVPGSDLNIEVGIAAVIGEEVSSRGAVALRGAFAELSRGSQLDRVIYDRSGLLRFSATPASVDIVLSRPTPAAASPGVYPATSIVQTGDGIQFATITDATFGDYTTSIAVSARALEVGIGSNVPAGAITSLGTSAFDSTITVANPTPAAGGTDAESDIQFLGRYRGFFPTLSKGILGAIEYGAKQVPGVAVATATEILNPSSGYPAAINQLVIGDRDGNATLTMIQAVSDMLLGYRAAGIPAIVLGGTVTFQAVQWSLAFKTGFDEKLAVSRVQAVTVAVSQFLPPGPENGILYRSSLIAAAKQVPGVIVSDSSLVFPLGDVVPVAVTEMIRVLPTGVTFS